MPAETIRSIVSEIANVVSSGELHDAAAKMLGRDVVEDSGADPFHETPESLNIVDTNLSPCTLTDHRRTHRRTDPLGSPAFRPRDDRLAHPTMARERSTLGLGHVLTPSPDTGLIDLDWPRE